MTSPRTRSLLGLLLAPLALTPTLAQFTVGIGDAVVSAQTGRYVYRPSVAASPNGQFAVSWGDERPTSDGRLYGTGSIYMSMFEPNGTPTVSNTRVDGMTFGFFHDFSLYHSAATFLPSGVLVVAYHVDARTTIESIKFDDIYYSAYSPAGVRTALQVQLNKVNGSGSGYGYQPSLGPHGPNFLVAYRYYVSDAYNIGISSVDGSTGALLGNAVPISDNTTNNRIYPFVASNGSHVVVVWTDGRTEPSSGDIYMQRFVNGSAVGGNTRVNTDAAGGVNLYARVAMNASGNFVVVWVDTRSHPGGDLYARVFSSNGTALGPEFKLTASNSIFNEYPPGVVMDASGDFVVTWADSLLNKPFSAKTRAFTSAGSPLIPITELTTSYATAGSIQPDVALGPGGTLVYAWLDGRLDASYGRIFVKTASIAGVTHADDEAAGSATAFGLDANYPNPFNPSTNIVYHLSRAGWARVTVYDLLGREVARLVDEGSPAGTFVIPWRPGDEPSGIYVVRLDVDGGSSFRKITLLR